MYNIPISVRSKRGDFLIGKPLHPNFIFFLIKYIINEREMNFKFLSPFRQKNGKMFKEYAC